jgi:hypothetical protein
LWGERKKKGQVIAESLSPGHFFPSPIDINVRVAEVKRREKARQKKGFLS